MNRYSFKTTRTPVDQYGNPTWYQSTQSFETVPEAVAAASDWLECSYINGLVVAVHIVEVGVE